jgi:hypothetical protein
MILPFKYRHSKIKEIRFRNIFPTKKSYGNDSRGSQAAGEREYPISYVEISQNGNGERF